VLPYKTGDPEVSKKEKTFEVRSLGGGEIRISSVFLKRRKRERKVSL
jgi:hypothetical protein